MDSDKNVSGKKSSNKGRSRSRSKKKERKNASVETSNKKEHGIEFSKIEQLLETIDSVNIVDVAKGADFRATLNNVWPGVDKQAVLLKYIITTTNAASQFDLGVVLGNVIYSTLIDDIFKGTVSKIPFSANFQTTIHAELVKHITKILLKGFESVPEKMKVVYERFQPLIGTLLSLPEDFLSDEILQDIENLKTEITKLIEASTVVKTESTKTSSKNHFKESEGPPPNNFRQLSIIPTSEDLSFTKEIYLRSAKINGPYENDEHYLDVQFRLLREDLIRPLREKIEEYKENDSKKLNHSIYKNIKLESGIYERTGELLFYANLQFKKNMKLDKKFMYGNLVCLSSDNFSNSLLFATIEDRSALKENKIGLKPQSYFNINLKYSMVESPTYFEAYSHVMKAFQDFPLNQPIPFSKYLVHAETDTQPPRYIKDEFVNIESMLTGDTKGDARFLTKISDFSKTFTPLDFNMDESQFEALSYALQSDLAIIQGPPGTGKTFIGLQITKLLLHKNNSWNSSTTHKPILVVCYTNHALDQFLEGISKFQNDRIVRIGGQSKNKELEKFMIYNQRTWKNPTLGNENKKLSKTVFALQKSIRIDRKIIAELNSRFADPYNLFHVLKPAKLAYLNKKINGSLIKKMSTWLTSYHEVNHYFFDIDLIEKLINRGFKEIQAKNALYRAYVNKDVVDVDAIQYKVENNVYENISETELETKIQHWPTFETIQKLKRFGFPKNAAAELLVSANNNLAIIEKELQLIQFEKKESTMANYFSDIELNDDESINRRIIDSKYYKNNNKAKKEAKNFWCDGIRIAPFRKYIVNSPPMEETEAERIKDIWKLSLPKRWRLYQRWISQACTKYKQELSTKEETYLEKTKERQKLNAKEDIEVMKSAKVIGMTTTGAAKNQDALKAIQPRIVIVEEAAEVLEAHLVASLTTGCEHLILIGDHKQLRPNPEVYELATNYNMNISLFERLIKNGFPYRTLKYQHRMCPDISSILMPHFYDNLKDHLSVSTREPVKGVTQNLAFITHSYPEEQKFKSYRNDFEVDFSLKLAKYFIQQGYHATQITILCTYLDQLIAMRKKAISVAGNYHEFTIQNVDNYQGEEADIVILSLVRSDNPENTIGFLKVSNRVCVALSRAKMGLYVIGNIHFLAKYSKLWKDIRASAEKAKIIKNNLTVKCLKHDNLQKIKSGADFDIMCVEGGCNKLCKTKLNCGHVCDKKCHNSDMEHLEHTCKKRCIRKCLQGHACKKECSQDCGNCMVKFNKKLPCGHTKIDYCYLSPENIQCNKKCDKFLRCNHLCKELCGAPCTQKAQCVKEVKRLIPKCKHWQKMRCCDDPTIFKCGEIVPKAWPLCKHSLEVPCHIDVTTAPCPKPCETILACDHICKGTCGRCRNGRFHIKCQEKCKRILFCGHECGSICSSACPPCQKLCETACSHSCCGTKPVCEKEVREIRLDPNLKEPTSGRTCGDPCPPCAEPCVNKCIHQSCKLLCHETCNISLCEQPCPKPLPCSTDGNPHYCIGACGEDCLNICKICNPAEYEKLLVDNSLYEPDENVNSSFIKLDCGHFSYTWFVDRMMIASTEDGEIKKISCLQCDKPISNSKRYTRFLNQRAAIKEKIKSRLRGMTGEERKQKQSKFYEKIEEIFLTTITFSEQKMLTALKEKMRQQSPTYMTSSWFTMADNVLKILSQLFEHYKHGIEYLLHRTSQQTHLPQLKKIKSDFQIANYFDFIQKDFNELISRIDLKKISDNCLTQFENETSRNGFLVEIFKYLNYLEIGNKDLHQKDVIVLNDMFEHVFSNNEFNESNDAKIHRLFKTLVEAHPFTQFGLSEQERIEIVKAADADITKWASCPQGHVYGIGNCGQAMVQANCPECGSIVGGENHRLREDNADATDEMRHGLPEQDIPDPFVVRYH